ncbi:MAG TPA: hypothetical protein VLO07_03020 [Thermoanaerobaculia bacterium]|nr:hypothetical protein [Thermoanaerobaculia bacterium]
MAGERLDWTERILSFPVRAAAVDTFLRELKARGMGDLNGVFATLNDGRLCQEALSHWLANEWVVVAPHSPLHALAGSRFSRELTLRQFCGEKGEPTPLETGGTTERTEETESHEDQ